MSEGALYDVGPRARRRIQVASVVAAVLLVLLGWVAVARLAAKGQFEGDRWALFTRSEVWTYLLGGLGNTLRAALTAMVLACVLGALLALGRISLTRPVRWATGTYVEVFRAVPLLLLIFFVDRALPRYGLGWLPAFWIVVIALVAYNGAVLGEIFRAGILSLDRGQREAAYAVGLSYWQAMLLVVIPQAVLRMLPALVSQLITLLKDTSLAFVLGRFDELLRRGEQIGQIEPRSLLQGYFVAALMFVVVNLTLSRLARRLELRQRRRYRSASIAGGEDLTVLEVEGGARLAVPR
jgi:glutamate transport system permease protein